jgi:hypothetical protein
MVQLWLTSLMLAPFSLSTMIGSKGTEGSGNKFTTPESMIEHLVETSKSYLGDSAKTRDGAGILLARLVIRTDMMSLGLLTSFASWATTCMEEAKANPFTVVGVLTTCRRPWRTTSSRPSSSC